MADSKVFRLVGADTISLSVNAAAANRVLADFGHGEIAKLTFATDIATVKTGKNGNAIFASNQSGNQANLEVKVLRGSSDDGALQSQLAAYKADPIGFVLINGTLVKKIGDGAGGISSDTFSLSGGVFTKNVEFISNVEGDVEQAISVYTLQFAFATRTLS
jgi:hypothetical protein